MHKLIILEEKRIEDLQMKSIKITKNLKIKFECSEGNFGCRTSLNGED